MYSVPALAIKPLPTLDTLSTAPVSFVVIPDDIVGITLTANQINAATCITDRSNE